MKKLKLKNFTEDTPKADLPLYTSGEILKLSKGLREARHTAVKHVQVTINPETSCGNCLFTETYCTKYLSVRCSMSERGDGNAVIFLPCLESGELL